MGKKQKEHALPVEIRVRYAKRLSEMTNKELLMDYEARGARSTGGFIDPVSKAMLKLARREVFLRLERQAGRGKKPPMRSKASLFDLDV